VALPPRAGLAVSAARDVAVEGGNLCAPSHAAFVSYVHSLRGVAILLVIAAHCAAGFHWERSPESRRVLESMFTNGTAVFVLIAGFLFQHLSAKYRYGDYLKSKFKNVILPYLILSVPAIIYYEVVHWNSADSAFHVAARLVIHYCDGRCVDGYWFIPMIGFFYVIAPLLIWWDRRPKAYWLLPVFLGISLCVPRGGVLVTDWVHFFSVYLLGMFCSRYREQVFVVTGRLIPLLLALVIGCTVAASLRVAPVGAFNLVQKLALSFLLLYWLRRYDRSLKPLFAYLATLSFGLYFIHPYVIEAFIKLPPLIEGQGFLAAARMHSLPEGSLALFLAYFVTLAFLSIVVVAIARRLFGSRSRMIVGS
jgi:surface polysaccharide O-acyltransferase-like enzyme